MVNALRYFLHPDFFKVLRGGAGRYLPRVVLDAHLEAFRRLQQRISVIGGVPHRAAPQQAGRDGVFGVVFLVQGAAQELLFAVQDPHPPRPAHLVDGKSQEIDVQLLHVYRAVGDRLRRVEQHLRPAGMRQPDDFPGRYGRAGQV